MKAWTGIAVLMAGLCAQASTPNAWTAEGTVIKMTLSPNWATTYWGTATLLRSDGTYALVYLNKSALGGYPGLTESQLKRVLPLFCQGTGVKLYAVGMTQGTMVFYYFHPDASVEIAFPQ